MQCLVSGECLPIARMLSVLLVHLSVTVTSARDRKACDAGDPTQRMREGAYPHTCCIKVYKSAVLPALKRGTARIIDVKCA